MASPKKGDENDPTDIGEEMEGISVSQDKGGSSEILMKEDNSESQKEENSSEFITRKDNLESHEKEDSSEVPTSEDNLESQQKEDSSNNAPEEEEHSTEPSKAETESSAGNSDEQRQNKRKRADEDEEEDDGNLNDTSTTATAESSFANSPSKEEDKSTEKPSFDDDLNVSPIPSEEIAKTSTATASKPGPLSKKPKTQPETSASDDPKLSHSDNGVNSQDVPPQPVSYIALMPVHQLLTLPTAVALPAGSVSDTPATVSSEKDSTAMDAAPSSSAAIDSQETDSPEPSTSKSKVMRADDDSRTPLITNSVDKATDKTIRFKKGKSKMPYRHAQPVRKKKTEKRKRNTVGDFNSSDEDGEEELGSELASLFYKQFGESKAQESKSLLDKLHRSIFPEESSDSESEEKAESGDPTLLSGKTPYKVVNCPGAGKYESFIGPLNSSKISIIRCQEFTKVKNFWYEVYKVRVTSSGREANTNIMIPVPEGYKVYAPSRGQEHPVHFSHTAHEDFTSASHINPEFLEKLANTELKLRKYKDEVKVLRTRYVELLKEYANRPQFSTMSDLVGAASKFLTEDQLVFFLMQLKSGARNMQGIRYSVREKVLALSIYQKSPEVYKWLRKLLNLPSKSVLERWLEDIGCQDPQLLKKLMYHVYANYNFKRNVF